MMNRTLFVLAGALTALSACNSAARQAREAEMVQSKSAYTECLMSNSSELSKCAALKEVYEADIEAYCAEAKCRAGRPVQR